MLTLEAQVAAQEPIEDAVHLVRVRVGFRVRVEVRVSRRSRSKPPTANPDPYPYPYPYPCPNHRIEVLLELLQLLERGLVLEHDVLEGSGAA